MIYKYAVRLITVGVLLIATGTHFHFLVLNTFLAYLSIEFVFQLQRTQNRPLQLILVGLWLLFFPNIPYLATDIVHADMLPLYDYFTGASLETIRGWGLILLLFLVMFAYIIWGFLSLFAVADWVKQTFQVKQSLIWLGIGATCWLSSMAMYAGRLAPRLHSVYLFRYPLHVLKIIFLEWPPKKIEFVLLFFALHLAIIGIILLGRMNQILFLKETDR